MTNKGLTILLVVICFVALTLVVVIAENDSNYRNNTNSTYNNNVSNMTFGRCVVESAKIRQVCYKEEQNTSKQCMSAANLTKNKEQAKQCLSNYKKNMNNCKINFREAKTNCVQIYKPNFWQRMWYAFR